MQVRKMTALAAVISLVIGSSALAGSRTTIQNLTTFNGVYVSSPEEALRNNADFFGYPPDLGTLKLTKGPKSLIGSHYHHDQLLHGLVVDNSEIIVSISDSGQLLQIFNGTHPVSQQASALALQQLQATKITANQALDHAWANMKVQQPLIERPASQLVWYADKDGFHLAHKVQIEAQMPTGGFVQYISALDGHLLHSYSTTLPRKGNGPRELADRAAITGPVLTRAQAEADLNNLLLKRPASMQATVASGINGSGYSFDPDPRTTLNTDALTDTSAASAFDAAYFTRSLRDLTVTSGVYKLSGPYVNITNVEAPNTAASTTTNGVWTAKRGNNAFNDSMTYFHLDQSQRYMQSLGFTGTKGIIERPIDVDTDGESGADNSHYSPGSPGNLVYGHGCVDDNEDADVILHEYGHAIQHNIDTNWTGGDTGAMGEGFGDYWAGSYSYSTPNGAIYHPEWIYSWDGHSSCWAGRMLNRTDAKYNSAKTYGAHTSVSEGGVSFQSDELWSAPLFAALTSLVAAGKPRDNVDKIILEAHFGLGSNVKMPVMATAIVNAAHNLFPADATYENTFKAKFEAQNILTGGTPPPPPPNSETESNDTTATANVIATAGTVMGANMGSSTDVDYFKVTLPAGKTLTATLTPNSSSDYDLYILNSSGSQVASSTAGTGAVDTASKKNTGTASKVFYIKVIYYAGGTGSTSGTYTLKAAW